MTIQPLPSDDGLNQWIFRLALTAVTFFLGWGLRDVKKRYDRVPELEAILTRLQDQQGEILRRLERLER